MVRDTVWLDFFIMSEVEVGEMARGRLLAILGPDEGEKHWKDAALAVNADIPPSLSDLVGIAQQLMGMGGLAGLVGRSLKINAQTLETRTA